MLYAAVQVCLVEGGRLPRRRVEAGEEPERAALCAVREQTGLQGKPLRTLVGSDMTQPHMIGSAALQQAVFGRPSAAAEQHVVTILYAVPVALSGEISASVLCHYWCVHSDVSSSTTDFHGLAMAMESPHVDHQDRYITSSCSSS